MMSQPTKRNYKVLIAVLALAFFFWFMVKMNKEYDYILKIPLEVTINNDEICLKYPAPKTVRVEFQGRGIDLIQLNFYNPTYGVDLTAEKDNFVLNLTEHREYVHLSDDLAVSVKSIISPHEIEFELDKCTEKKVPIHINTEIKTENGFILVNARPNPDSIRVVGPATYVDTLKSLSTVRKNYSKVDLAFHDKLRISRNERFYGQYIPESVEVFFDVQRLAEKEIEDVPVDVVNVPPNYEVVPLPSSVAVYVKGGEKVLAEAGTKDFRVVIDFQRDWQPGATRVKASVETGLNISYVESRPQLFELIVQKKRARTN